MVADWLFPASCAGCGVRAPEGLCASCAAGLRRPPPRPPPPGVTAWHAAVVYEGAAREAVARLKYRNARAVLGLLAARLDGALPRDLGVEAVTWVPTTARRRRSRGFDHAELLARALARRRGLPARALVRRLGTATQTGRDAAARWWGPVFAPAGRGPVPRAVLMVDDVVTTGASVRNAAAVLRGQGCETVIVGAVAATLLKRSSNHSEKPNGGSTRHVP